MNMISSNVIGYFGSLTGASILVLGKGLAVLMGTDVGTGVGLFLNIKLIIN